MSSEETKSPTETDSTISVRGLTCNKCKTGVMSRSTRLGIFEGLFLRLIFVAPVRCMQCKQRTFVLSFFAPPSRSRRRWTLARFLGLKERNLALREGATILFVAMTLLALTIALALSLVNQ